MSIASEPAPPFTGWIATTACWLLILPGALWAVVRVFGWERGPLVQLLAFTPYVAVWSVLPLLAMLVARRWWLAVAAGVVVLAMAMLMLPRGIGSADAAPKGVPLTMLSQNMQIGGADPATLVGLVRDQHVDVLALQEYTAEAETALQQAGLTREMPYREAHPLPGAAGSAVYSRFPLSNGGVRTYAGWWFHQAYATVAVPGAQPVLVESVHPCAPAHPGDLSCWWSGLAAQPGPSDGHGPARILVGDFNATLDHVALRRILDRGYRDAASEVGSGLIGTWGPYTGHPIPPVTLDHVLLDHGIAAQAVSIHRTPHTDHRAVLAELTVPASGT